MLHPVAVSGVKSDSNHVNKNSFMTCCCLWIFLFLYARFCSRNGMSRKPGAGREFANRSVPGGATLLSLI